MIVYFALRGGLLSVSAEANDISYFELRKSHFLFLGYSLRDWNLRVILHRIWGDQKLTYKSWAIQLNPERLDQEFWRKRDVDIFNVSLETYIAELDKRLRAFPARATA